MNDAEVFAIEDINHLAREHKIQIHIWDLARNHQIPKLITHSEIPNVNSELHLCAPYCNEPNDYSLEDLHIIRDIRDYKKKVTNTTTGNIFQVLELSGMVTCQSWQQLMDMWGSDKVRLNKERQFRDKFNVGFEIFRVERGRTNRCLKFVRLYKSVRDEHYISLEFAGNEWSWDKSALTLDDEFILRNKGCSLLIYKR